MIRDSVYDAMGAMLRDRFSVEAVAEVVAAETDSRENGYDSYRFTEVFVRIWYRTTSGDVRSYEYEGDFGDLIRALTD